MNGPCVLPTITTKKAAEAICGKLSYPSKMPGPAYSISNQMCMTGGALRKIKGSVCEKCYAGRNNYLWPAVKQSMQTRWESLGHPQWVAAVSYLIADSGCGHFRWHDSGDLQSLQHLMNIVSVAEGLPDVGFYLPTKEKSIVKKYLATFGEFPKNLVVRVSAAMIDAEPCEGVPHTSVVIKTPREGLTCPAKQQGNKCGDCRACWDPTVKNINYPYH